METKNNWGFFCMAVVAITFVYSQTIYSSASPCIFVCDIKNPVRLLLFPLPGDLRAWYFYCHLLWNFMLERRVCYSLKAVQDTLLFCLAPHLSSHGISLVSFFAGLLDYPHFYRRWKAVYCKRTVSISEAGVLYTWCLKFTFLSILSAHTYITEDFYQYIPSDSKPGKGKGRRKDVSDDIIGPAKKL